MPLSFSCFRLAGLIAGICVSLPMHFAPASAQTYSPNGCSAYAPGPGDTIICNNSYPSSTSGVQTPINNTGNNNVTVLIDSNAVRSINGSTVGLGSGSTVINAGALDTQSFFNGYGISFGVNGRSKAGGNTVINSGTVTSAGNNGDAIHIDSSNASSAANSVTNSGTLRTSGANAEGIWIDSRSAAVTVDNSGTIRTSGSNSDAVQAANTGHVISLSNSGTMEAQGTGSNAIDIRGAARIDNSGRVLAADTAILLTNSSNTTRTIVNNSGTIQSSGAFGIDAQQSGVDVYNAGTISGVNSAIQFLSAATPVGNSVTLYASSSINGGLVFNPQSSAETLTFSGLVAPDFGNAISGVNSIFAASGARVTLTNGNGYGLVNGRIDVDASSQLEIAAPIINQATPAAASSLRTTGQGVLILSAANTYTGATMVDAGTLLLTGSLTSATSIASGATLMGTGVITGNVSNAGTVAPGLFASQGILTINGNYTGTNGALATRIWGTPAAPQADRLAISGVTSVASGTTRIIATNQGGLGAATSGNGILLIDAQNGALTQAGAFTLAQRVAAGAYEYNLYRGGIGGSAAQSWFLRSEMPAVAPDNGAGQISNPVPQPVPATEPTSTAAPAAVPASAELTSYRVETSVYPALAVAQRLYVFGLVDTLDQRRGVMGQASTSSALPNGGWGRVNGSAGSLHNGGPDGFAFSFNQGFLQTGLDVFGFEDQAAGKTLAGFFIAAGQASGTTSTPLRGMTGQAALSAYSAGLYATHFQPNGLYADALVQGTRFVNGSASTVVGTAISSDGWSGSASLEGGWRIAPTQDTYIVPQAQLVVDSFSMAGASDLYGLIAFPSQSLLRGHLGILAGIRLTNEMLQQPINMWVRASVWDVFNGTAKTQFSTLSGSSPVLFNTPYGSSWLGFDAGVTAQLSKQAAFYANAGYDYGFGLSRQAFTGRLGLQMQW